LVEIPAGRIDAGETPEAAARREVEEELGFRVRALVPMGSMLPSPGASSERIWLFRAEVEAADRTSEGGGVEDENLQVVEISPAEALAKLQRGELLDAKTQIAILRADFVD
jgi:ADP-ribose pyrophosphatase